MAARPDIGQQISWVYCEDLAATCPFYQKTLGLRQVMNQGTARIFLAAPGAFIGVCRAFEGRAVEPEGSMISLVTDEVDAWYERLTAAGVKTRGRPRTLEAFNIYCFFAEDPNGYVIEFQQFLDPAWSAASAQAPSP